MITIFGATLFCGDFNSSNSSYSNAIVFLINSLQVFSTFLLLVFTVIKLGHRITQGNCAAVNTTRQYFRTTWPYHHIEFIEFFNFDLVSSHMTYHKYNICIHSFLLSHFWCLTLCSANQWTGFYVITASVMKGLNLTLIFIACEANNEKNSCRIDEWIIL